MRLRLMPACANISKGLSKAPGALTGKLKAKEVWLPWTAGDLLKIQNLVQLSGWSLIVRASTGNWYKSAAQVEAIAAVFALSSKCLSDSVVERVGTNVA